MAAEAEIEAVRETLRDYLLAQLQPQFPAVEVQSDWPNGSELAEQVVSVLATGEGDITNHSPRPVSSTPTSGANGLVTYAYGYAEGVQLSIDAWASTKPKRDALALAIRRAMNRPPQATLGVGGALPTYARRANVSLAVSTLFGAIFTYRFEQIPAVVENSSAAQRNEWRSTFRGTADGPLFEQDTMALMKTIGISGYVGPGALGDPAGNQALSATRPAPQTAVLVVPSIAQVVHGATLPLKAYAVLSGGGAKDITATAAWSTSDPLKATVNASGVVTGVAAGTCTITATSGGFHGTCALTVA